MYSKYLNVLLLVLSVVFLACDAGVGTALTGNQWTLVSFQDAAGDVTPVPRQMASTLYFDKAKRAVTGTVRCNRLTSTYWAAKRRIHFGNIAVTEMGCGPDPEGQEQFVLNVLGALTTYSIKNDTLQLRSKTGDLLTYQLAEDVVPDDEILEIEIGSSFGMCLGYCNKTMTVGPQTTVLTQTGRPAEDYPQVTREIATSPNRWNELIALADLTAFNSLPEVIGCPDCADGGAETISITTATGTRKVTIEFNAQIKEIEPLLAALRALKEEMFAQIDADANQLKLDQNKALWESSGIENYQFTFRRACECLPEEDIVVTVEAGRIVSAVYTPSQTPVSDDRLGSLDTVDDLFDLIQEAVSRPAAHLMVQYDGADGHPTDIYIDWDEQIADEETSYQIFSFQPILT